MSWHDGTERLRSSERRQCCKGAATCQTRRIDPTASRATHRRRQLRSCRPRRPPRKHQQERRRRRRHPPKKHPPRVLSPRHQSLPRRPSVCSSGSKPTASLQLLLRMQRHKQSRQWKAPTTPWRATHQSGGIGVANRVGHVGDAGKHHALVGHRRGDVHLLSVDSRRRPTKKLQVQPRCGNDDVSRQFAT